METRQAKFESYARESGEGVGEMEIKIPLGARLFRFVSGPIFRGLFHVLTRVHVEGLENVPSDEGYLVTANHVSIYDPPLVLTFWPKPLEIAGAVAVLERPFQGQLMRLYGTLHVKRGLVNRDLLRTMIQYLRSGKSIYIAPEGRRSHVPGMVEARFGAAYVAAKAGAPVVPVGISGTDRVVSSWRRARRPNLRMMIGLPLELPSIDFRSPKRKQGLKENTELIMQAIAALLPLEYRGLYA